MAEDVEYDGVRAVRSWALEAIERARSLLPPPEQSAPPVRHHDQSVTELTELSRLLDEDPVLRSSVTIWLGGALTLRHTVGGGTPQDRERARDLLREARDPTTEIGATAAAVEDRRWAALFLLTHTMPVQETVGGIAPELDATAFFDRIMREGVGGMVAHAAEVQELINEAAELPLHPEALAQLRQMRDFQDAPSPEAMADLLNGMLPADGAPGTEALRDLVTRMFGGPERTEGQGTEPGERTESGSGPRTPRTSTPRTPEEMRGIIAAMQAANTTSVDFVNQIGGGDPAALNQQLARLHEAMNGLPEDAPNKDGLEGLMALLLGVSEGAGGTREDKAAGDAHAERLSEFFRRNAETSNPMADSFPVMADGLRLMTGIRAAGETDDQPRLCELLSAAEEFADSVPADHDIRAVALTTRAMARLALGRVTMERQLLLGGLADWEEAREAAKDSRIPIPFGGLDAMPDLETIRASLSDDTADPNDIPLPEPEVPPEDAPADQLYTAATRLTLRYSLTRDLADLEAVITTWERFREHIREGRAPRVAAESLWFLTEAYRERWHRQQHEADLTAAVDTADEALSTLAADVLLERGAENRLATARGGASQAIKAALWAASHGRVEGTATALESGRALVLQAAATSRSVPDLLRERGHPARYAATTSSPRCCDSPPTPPC